MNDEPADEPTRPPDAPTDGAADRRPADSPNDPRHTDAMTDTQDETATDPRTTGSGTAPTTDPTVEPSAATDGGTAGGKPNEGDDAEPGEADGSRFSRLSSDDLRGLLDRIGLAALVLLALIAGWSFYGQTGRAIRTWLDPAYQPIALAAFNLAVLFVALAGVAHQLRRIRAGDDADPEPSRSEESSASREAER
ncbi:hypothetical protein [Halorubrum halodurans]|uniref:DUF8060 domain-containing protein n=1 Tax=Halorubrum halodurans TaxID=1383851 RepID=A0A256INQ4_9EURY|nr:hypothetical protein [Halorubrum halodurans]OYR58073.1 hypothetical protein DJ70_04220 [Halorubrum halodurans]